MPYPGDHDHTAYLDPHWLPYSRLAVSVDDLGFLQAATAVERLRTYGGRAVQVDAHLRRFMHTCSVLAIDRLPDAASLASRIDELLVRNASWMNQRGDAGVVLFATPGRVGSHRRPSLGIHLSPLDQSAIRRRQTAGQPLVVTEVRQPSPASWPRDIKVRCRLHYYLADLQAQRFDRDAVAILLDDDGSITETSVANLALVRDGRIASPPADRVLPGVTQSLAMRLAASAGIDWQQRSLTVDDLLQADEVLLMGTTSGIWFGSVAAVGGAASTASAGATRRPRPVCRALQTAFADAMAAASRD